ncbi:MAG TPA: hypothetical protein VHC97_09305 [Thermoanaerobaculia bacterium]|jgi:hypothetical protein|nr:hypothetical protein [Thermoanaerobaculia bacterium]
MKLSSRALNICCATLLTLSAIPQATAEDSFQARKRLLQAARAFTGQGYRLRGEPYVSHMEAQASERIRIQLAKGVTYVLVSVCDQYCSGIDLTLSKDGGEDVQIERKDRAIVMATPREAVTLGLEVTMAECSEAPCYYGIGIFTK